MKANIYKAFLASPGDTQNERIVAEKVVEEINQTLGEYHNFRLELLKWENNTYPDFGHDAEDVIIRQIGNDYDIFIGIMWKRFGTPTNHAESGTEEEFEIAYKRFQEGGNVKIMFYFNSSALPQTDIDLEQFTKVLEFKKKISGLGGYYSSYDSIISFEKFLRIHLQKVLLELTTLNEMDKESLTKTTATNIVPQISESFATYLNDVEATFAHSKVDKIFLEDIYITPDLKDISSSKRSSTYKAENLSELSNAIEYEGIKHVLVGNELAGKTAACKYLFSKYFNIGLFPVLINGSEINNNIRSEAIIKIVESKIAEQYKDYFKIVDFPKERFVLIIDDFHKSAKSKNRYWPILIKNIEKEFNHIILTGNALMPIENISKRDAFKNFKLYTILEFGPKFRYEIVNKWHTLGVEERFLDKNELLRKNDATIAHFNTIIGKNYIPSYPFYLLSILQALESGNVQNPNYSVHGFYYELLINDCFSKAVEDKKEISLYYNYLTFFSYYLFEQDIKEVSIQDFKAFHIAYCTKHDITYNFETILRIFYSAKLLYIDGKVYIKEKYVYYFFVAKYIANNISKPEIRNIVSKMSMRVFKDEYASIIMFVTHLSKDEFIINELLKNANSIFLESSPAMLQEDIKGINELITNLPNQVLELVDVSEKREEEIKDQEESERLEKEKEFEKESTNYDNFNLEDDISTIDLYAKITLALKTIDILGQIAKKHWGEIDGKQKFNLVISTYNLGLRTLSYYLQLLQRNSEEIVELIKELIDKKHIKDRFSLKQTIEETAQTFVFRLCFMASFGIIKRISNSIGYDKLKNSFEKVLNQQPSNSVKLIDLAIKLGYLGIPMNIVEGYKKEMEGNKLSYIVLQNLVIDHIYMFETDYKIKSKICSTLGINIQDQLKIDATSAVKKK